MEEQVTRSARNIEIKTYDHYPNKTESLIKERLFFNNDKEPDVIYTQLDTFFQSKQGRLKLRLENETKSRLIYYERDNQNGPKESKYLLLELHTFKDYEILRDTLIRTNGIIGEVKKDRILYLYEQTRIHLDKVKGLDDSSFLELEVVLNGNQTIEEGESITKDIMKKIELSENDLIECSYLELLQKSKRYIDKIGHIHISKTLNTHHPNIKNYFILNELPTINNMTYGQDDTFIVPIVYDSIDPDTDVD